MTPDDGRRRRSARRTGAVGDEATGPRWPSFIVIGAQKSASSLLSRFLERHPEVWMPSPEVPSFEDPFYGDGGLEAMHELLAAAPAGRVVGIKRPDYLARPECAPRIRAHVPDARLVAILRHPVDRALSAYYHYIRYGWIPARPASEAFRDMLDGAYDRYPRAAEVLEFGRYHHHLRRYLELFPASQLCVLLFEDLTRSEEGYAQVQEFIGVTPRPRPAVHDDDANKGIYSLPRLRYRSLVRPLTERQSHDLRYITFRENLLGRALLRVDVSLLSRLFPEHKPVLEPEIRARLVGYYAEDVRHLERLLGRDLAPWLGEEAAPSPAAE